MFSLVPARKTGPTRYANRAAIDDLDGITVPTEPQSMNEIGPFANGKTYYIRRWERESDGFLRLHLIRKDS